MSERRERSYDLKTFEPTRKIFKEREKERERWVFAEAWTNETLKEVMRAVWRLTKIP